MNDLEAMQNAPLHLGFVSENVLSLIGHLDPSQPRTILKMDDGTTLRIDTSVLMRATDNRDTSGTPSENEGHGQESAVTIPLVEERLEVGKRTRPTGMVRLHQFTQTHTQALDEVLAVRTFEVERVVLNRPVDSAPPVRQEGSTTIYSLVEEQLVLTKQLILTEEVRIVQRDAERRDTQVVTLQKDHLTVERETL